MGDKLTGRYSKRAVLVFDKFYLLRHLNQAVDTVRKQEAEQLKATAPELLKGAKYLFLKNPWNLTPKQQQRLGMLEKLNLKTNLKKSGTIY